ncbi:unnamed protein product [Ectocarpus sp. 4 AP-2014]
MRRKGTSGFPGPAAEPAGRLLDRAPSAPSVMKVGVALTMVWALYATLLLAVSGRERAKPERPALQPTSDLTTMLAGGHAEDPKPPKPYPLRNSFRQLNMMGFEEGNGQGGEWTTCRAYKEAELGPDKKQRSISPRSLLSSRNGNKVLKPWSWGGDTHASSLKVGKPQG